MALTRTAASAATVGRSSWRRSLRLERVGIELVPDAPDREDELGARVIALDPFAEPADVDVHGARFDVQLGSPYEVEELEPIVHPIRVTDEELEKLELAEREVQALPVDEDLVRVEIEPEAAALEHLVRRLDVLAVRAPENRPHARDELSRAERLGDVVVRAELEPEDAVHLG